MFWNNKIFWKFFFAFFGFCPPKMTSPEKKVFWILPMILLSILYLYTDTCLVNNILILEILTITYNCAHVETRLFLNKIEYFFNDFLYNLIEMIEMRKTSLIWASIASLPTTIPCNFCCGLCLKMHWTIQYLCLSIQKTNRP